MPVPQGGVPPMSASQNVHTNSSPQLAGVGGNPMSMAPDLNLTPQFGPLLGSRSNHHDPRTTSNMPDVDVSFLNSPLPNGMTQSGAEHSHFVHQYMPVYTSPAYNPMGGAPAYSPMFGVPASPMFYGAQPNRGGPKQQSFDPLPESSWSASAKEKVRTTKGPSYPPRQDDYGRRAQNRQIYGGGPSHAPSHYSHVEPRGGRIAQFSHMGSSNNHIHNPFTHSNPDFNAQAGKSVILEDLRSVPHPRAHTLQDIVAEGLVADLATDQNGSRFIQTKLEEASDADKQAVFEQILPETLRLCTDVFGNYCIQKFFEYGTPEQKHQLSQKIKHRVLPLSLQMYGCRVVQKILESVDAETQNELIRELDQHVLECVKDQNANHVIQKCIEQVNSSNNIDFIIKAFYGRVFDLSTHPYGCRVIQRMLEHCYPNLKELTEPVLDELMSYAEQLAKDQYGNYVLQHVLQHSSQEARDNIVDVVARNILAFSKHKFASNVVERCFVSTQTKQRDILLNAVIGNAESSPLVSMVRDQYGNYVIQKMLETLNVPQRNKLIRKVSEYVPNIRKIGTFGKHIVAKIEKLTGKVV
jgi:pumilio RNA-binding family